MKMRRQLLLPVLLLLCLGPAIFQVNRIALIWAMLMNFCPAQNSLDHHTSTGCKETFEQEKGGVS
jgi:hypothetical protein